MIIVRFYNSDIMVDKTRMMLFCNKQQVMRGIRDYINKNNLNIDEISIDYGKETERYKVTPKTFRLL